MCGISGMVLGNGQVSEDVLEENNNIMKHRGPDDSGIWISKDKKTGFSHSRLSIVDLDKRSKQPMIFENEKIVIIFNGEIYNYVELRKKLQKKYKFRTTSDTEVLGYLYIEKGVKLLDEIEGMFAFAIYEKEQNKTFIARDFIGQKPLIYCQDKEGFFFGSEIPVILNSNPKLDKKIDYGSLGVFLTPNFSHIPAPFTIFKNIKKLEPSHYIIVKQGNIIEKKQYYKLQKKKLKKRNEADFICRKVNWMKPLDVKYASFLSGGNDSSLVCSCLEKEAEKKVEVYTLKVGNTDKDFERAKYVAKTLHLKHSTTNFNFENFLNSLEDQIKNFGEPYYHITSVYADYILNMVAKKYKVLFSGAGGDEVYYGYDNIQFILIDFFLKSKKIIPNFLFKVFLPKKYSFLHDANHQNFKEKYYSHCFNRTKNIFDSQIVCKKTKEYLKKISSQIFILTDAKNYLDISYMAGIYIENSHSLTIQSDLVGMKNSVEIRCPFLEKKVIESGYSLPLHKKISIFRIREGKEVIKKALLKTFSKKFVYSKKIGFGVEFKGQKKILELHTKKISKYLKDLAKRKEFSNLEISNILKRKKEKKFILLMKLYCIETWFKEFIDKKNHDVNYFLAQK